MSIVVLILVFVSLARLTACAVDPHHWPTSAAAAPDDDRSLSRVLLPLPGHTTPTSSSDHASTLSRVLLAQRQQAPQHLHGLPPREQLQLQSPAQQPSRRLLAALVRAPPTRPCMSQAASANSLIRNGWLLKYVAFWTPKQCPASCRLGAVGGLASGIYSLSCSPRTCRCAAINKRTRQSFPVVMREDGVMETFNMSGERCPAAYGEGGRLADRCASMQDWCRPGTKC